MEPKLAEAQTELQAEVMATLMNDHLATKDDFRELKNDIVVINQNIQHVEIKMDDNFGLMDHRFESMDQRFIGIEHRLDALDQRFKTVDHRFDGINDKIDLVNGKVDALESKLSSKMVKTMAASTAFISALVTVIHFFN